MADSVFLTVQKTIQERVAGITVAGGYRTDAGLSVFRGRAAHGLERDVLPFLSVAMPRDTVVAATDHAAQIEGDVLVTGYTKAADRNNPMDSAEELFADLWDRLTEVKWLSGFDGTSPILSVDYQGREVVISPELSGETIKITIHLAVRFFAPKIG